MLFPRPRAAVGVAGSFVAALVITAGIGSASTTATRPPSHSGRLNVYGSTRDGATLSASRAGWRYSPTSFAFQWQRCDSSGGKCTAIGGATRQRYLLTTADVGHRMRVVVTARNSAGTGTATSIATRIVRAASGSAPSARSKPSISGNPQEGQTLSTTHASWSGSQPISIADQWQRCDGANCADIQGATGMSYNATSADVTHTLRVRETARNSRGTATATSDPTALITPARPGAGGAAINVAQVSLPDRLVVDNVKFSPNPLRSRRSLVARFHVSDTRGFSIQGALVYALGLPYGWTQSAAEQPTNAAGWATIVLQPTRALPLRRGGALVVFVRARKPGDNLLAGVSTRRLVQASIR